MDNFIHCPSYSELEEIPSNWFREKPFPKRYLVCIPNMAAYSVPLSIKFKKYFSFPFYYLIFPKFTILQAWKLSYHIRLMLANDLRY